MEKLFKIIIIFLVVGIVSISTVIIYQYFDSFNSDNNSETKINKDIIMKLYGDTNIIMYVNDKYIEPGYLITYADGLKYDGEVKISSDINNKEVGKYQVKYLAVHNQKIEYELIRNVQVIEKPIKNNTILELIGEPVKYILLGSSYIDEGVKALDEKGIDISKMVITNNNVDTNVVGKYQVIYKINGSDLMVTRNVNVLDIKFNHDYNSTNLTNQNITINVETQKDDLLYIVLPDNSVIYNNVASFSVSENGVYQFKIYNKYNLSKSYDISVNNIDKVLPRGSCFFDGTLLKVNASDSSGIKGYSYSSDDKTYSNYTTKDSSTNMTRNGYVKIMDNAGNIYKTTCTRVSSIGPGFEQSVYTDSLGYNCLYPYTCFKQRDYNDPYQATSRGVFTISGAGCLPTSLAITISGYKLKSKSGNIYTPSTLVKEVIYKGSAPFGYSNYDRAYEVITKLGLKGSSKLSLDNNIEIFKTYLRDGYPVVVAASNGCYTTGGHYMAVLGINQNNQVFLSDPYQKTYTSIKGGCSVNTWVDIADLTGIGNITWFMGVTNE